MDGSKSFSQTAKRVVWPGVSITRWKVYGDCHRGNQVSQDKVALRWAVADYHPRMILSPGANGACRTRRFVPKWQ